MSLDVFVQSFFDREFVFKFEEEGMFPEDVVSQKMKKLQEDVHAIMKRIGEVAEGGLCRWRQHTHQRHLLAGLAAVFRDRFHSPLPNQAYCKLYEILVRYPRLVSPDISDKFKTLHLCEAPGNFIAAINVFLAVYHPNIKWKWTANSLNPHYEFTHSSEMLLMDDLIVTHHDRWIFGTDNSGDVKKLVVGEKLGLYDVITADGSCYVQDDPENQEVEVYSIIEAEIRVALAALRDGGSLILKVYSTFDIHSIRLFVLLLRSFRVVSGFKPAASKSGNAERYLICREFIRESADVNMEVEKIKPSLVEMNMLYRYNLYFSSAQMFTMEENLREFIDPRLTKESLEVARAQCIAMYKHTVLSSHWHLIDEQKFALVSLYDANGKNPWKERQPKNHVEELKRLEDPERAREYLRDTAREEAMKYEETREEEDDDPIYIEWADEEVWWLDVSPSEYLYELIVSVPFVPQAIQHSLFVDLRMFHALRGVDPNACPDMCPCLPYSVDGRRKEWREEKTVVICEEMHDKHEWIRFLKAVVHYEIPEVLIRGEGVLVLSRFSVSILTFLSVFYHVVAFGDDVKEFCIKFDRRNYVEDLPFKVKEFVDHLGKVEGNVLCFVPPSIFADLFPHIYEYNKKRMLHFRGAYV